jgi:hypothetical protein
LWYTNPTMILSNKYVIGLGRDAVPEYKQYGAVKICNRMFIHFTT